jgi:hypothetical protein
MNHLRIPAITLTRGRFTVVNAYCCPHIDQPWTRRSFLSDPQKTYVACKDCEMKQSLRPLELQSAELAWPSRTDMRSSEYGRLLCEAAFMRSGPENSLSPRHWLEIPSRYCTNASWRPLNDQPCHEEECVALVTALSRASPKPRARRSEERSPQCLSPCQLGASASLGRL